MSDIPERQIRRRYLREGDDDDMKKWTGVCSYAIGQRVEVKQLHGLETAGKHFAEVTNNPVCEVLVKFRGKKDLKDRVLAALVWHAAGEEDGEKLAGWLSVATALGITMNTVLRHKGQGGKTALHRASAKGRLENVKLLIERGLDPPSTKEKAAEEEDADTENPSTATSGLSKEKAEEKLEAAIEVASMSIETANLASLLSRIAIVAIAKRQQYGEVG